MSEGILIVVSGFSGSGKGTITKKLVDEYEDYIISVSATTRAPREGEVEGREYFFKTREEFEKLIADDALVEYAQYVNNYYGTPKAFVEENLKKGKNVILEIEVQGAIQIQHMYPDAVTIFMSGPSIAEIKKRLIARGTETLEQIESRLRRAKEEVKLMGVYDHLIINYDRDECTKELNDIIVSSKNKLAYNKAFIEKITKELEEY